jgi:hypothetical protein
MTQYELETHDSPCRGEIQKSPSTPLASADGTVGIEQ